MDGEDLLTLPADAGDASDLAAGLADAADALAGLGDLPDAADALAGLGNLVADLPNLADGVAALMPAEAVAVPVEALPLAAAGMTGGACLDYWMGRAGVARLLLHPRLQAHPRTGALCRGLAVKLDGAAPLLRRHGWWMMLVAHAFGHGRSTMALAAGAGRLPLRRFLAIEVPAAVLWATIFAGGGYLLADRWQAVELALRQVGAIGLLLVPAAGAIWWWRRSRRARRTAGARPA